MSLKQNNSQRRRSIKDYNRLEARTLIEMQFPPGHRLGMTGLRIGELSEPRSEGQVVRKPKDPRKPWRWP